MTIIAIGFIVVGIGLIGYTLFSIITSLKDTPTNLNGFYGRKYLLISIASFLSSVLLIAGGIAMLIGNLV